MSVLTTNHKEENFISTKEKKAATWYNSDNTLTINLLYATKLNIAVVGYITQSLF